LWSTKGSPTPPLVTTTSAAAFNQGSPPFAGALGSPGTTVLFGGRDLDTGVRAGGRAMIGYWFCDDHCLGIEAGGFSLGSKTDRFHAESLGNTLLGRPFFDASMNGASFVQPIAGTVIPRPSSNPLLAASPQVFGGNVDVLSRSSFWGAEANLRSNCWCGPCCYIDLLLGYRHLGLDDTLEVREAVFTLVPSTITSAGAVIGTIPPVGSAFQLTDRFVTHNQFYGVQVGADAEFRFCGCWALGVIGKVGLGPTQQVVDIQGTTVTNVPGVGTTISPNSALLAQPTNVGRHVRDQFTVVPEIGLKLAWQICDHWRFTVGYNFLYWSNVARAGNQVDPLVDARLVGGATPTTGPMPVHPNFQFHGTDFWAQGVTLGLEYRY
jgi:hypothetical protein